MSYQWYAELTFWVIVFVSIGLLIGSLVYIVKELILPIVNKIYEHQTNYWMDMISKFNECLRDR